MTVGPKMISVTTTHSVRRGLLEACTRLLSAELAQQARTSVSIVYERLRLADTACDSREAFTLMLDTFADPAIQAQMPTVWEALDQLDSEAIASERKATFIYWSYMVGIQRIDRDSLLQKEVKLLNQVLGEDAGDVDSLKTVCHWAGVEYEDGTYSTADDLKVTLLKAGIPVYNVYAALPAIFNAEQASIA